MHMIQPIVPHYRVPFFEGIARRSDLAFSLSASPWVRAFPPAADVPGLRVDSDHEYVELMGGAFIWQRRLALSPDLEPGAVLVVSGNPRLLSNYPLMVAARRRSIATVWWGHAWSATSRSVTGRIRSRIMRMADVVLLYTDAERRDLLAQGFDAQRVFALNNALDEREIARLVSSWPADRLDRFRADQDLTNRHVLLFCGRLRKSPSTDVDVALRALPRLLAKDDRYLFVVIGDGADAQRLGALAGHLGVAGHVRWLGAIYQEDRLAPWFLSARCFVYPGSVGLSLVQALGYGLPVITHDNRLQHNPEIDALEAGVNGLTFPRGDSTALAACVRQVCEDESLRARMSRMARRTVETRYSMAAMVERFAQAVTAASRAISP